MKTIIKTKIIGTDKQETKASKRKGKILNGLAAGLFGASVMSEQDKWNYKRKKEEQVVTFLIIYDDNTRETKDTIKGDNDYNNYILYLE